MTVRLELLDIPDLPVEVDVITPTHFVGKSVSEIGSLEVFQGNQRRPLSDFFEVSGSPGGSAEDTEIVVSGNLRMFKMIGKGMDGGKITVEGSTGMYLGAEMVSGRIHVKGSVGAWSAAEMEGGNIQIEGDASDYLCAGYRGSTDGMRGGRVYVAGDVGREMASHMRRGFISVKGNVGMHAAARMRGGSIIIVGDLAERAGVQATRGMLFVLGKVESLLPTYRFSGSSRREFVNYYLRYLKDRRPDFMEEDVSIDEEWAKYMGDFAEGEPQEEIYFRKKMNEHLFEAE